MNTITTLRCAASLALGLAISSAHPAGIAAVVTMPALALRQPTRRLAYSSAVCYYAGALWALLPGAKNFFGPHASALDAIALWAVAAILLALPWPLVWTVRVGQFLWRTPLSLALTVVPPLGLIGWASPLTAAGLLFPGTAWFGILYCAFAAAALAAWPGIAAPYAAAVAMAFNLIYPGEPQSPPEWEAINTKFGAIAHGPVVPTAGYITAEYLQNRARSSSARVIVFPESVVPIWNEATDLFWQQTLAALAASGKTILVGAILPVTPTQPPAGPLYDFAAEIAALQGANPLRHSSAIRRSPTLLPTVALSYQNAVIIRGAQSGTFLQRIPVPIAMWRPFTGSGVPLNLSGPGVVTVAGERVAILICYEQLLTYPILTSMLQHPTVIVALANDHWASHTTIPQFQLAAARAWARLFALPYLSATNS